MARSHYIRDSNLKDVVLDQLLPQHDDAELNAELHEAASRGTLQTVGNGERSGQWSSEKQRHTLSQAVMGQGPGQEAPLNVLASSMR